MNADSFTGKVVLGIVRHFITTLSGGFVAQGLINHDQQQTLVAGAMVAFGLGLSIYDKSQQQRSGAATQKGN